MTGKGVLIQGVLAALGLGAVYSTWQREPERAPGEATILNLGKKDLQNIHYEDDNAVVDLFRQGETAEGEPDVWLKILEKKTPPKPHGAPPEAAADKDKAPAPTPVTKELRGDDSARRLWKDFAPLRSPRAFGALDAAKAKELGVDEASAKKKLTVNGSGQTFSFVLGQPSAHGSGETYLRDLKDGRVFLATRQMTGDLQGASHRLVDRRLFGFKQGEFDRITVSAGGKTRALTVVNRHDPVVLKLAPANTPEKPDETLRTWHDKIWRLSAAEVFGKDQVPPDGTPKVDLRVEYFDKAKSVGWVELAHVDKAAEPLSSNAKSPPPANNTLFGRSSHTAGWVRVPFDPALLPDGEKIASGT